MPILQDVRIMKRTEAEEICQDLIMGRGELARQFKRWTVCGSIRRLCENVGDIDIVAIEEQGGFGEPTLSQKINLLDLKGPSEAKQSWRPTGRFLAGPAIKRFQYRGIMIDLYLATEKTFETLVLIRTGSKEHNIRLTRLAMSKGMKLKAGGEGLVARNNEAFIYEDTEDGILMKLLGRIPPPEQRN